jgi:hypothetical protein
MLKIGARFLVSCTESAEDNKMSLRNGNQNDYNYTGTVV